MKQLLDVPEEHVFRLKDGHTIKNLHSFLIHLVGMDDDTFEHHVNSEKNDFHSWVHHIVQDHNLAKKIHMAKNRKKMTKVVDKHIRKLEKKKHAHQKGVHFGAKGFCICFLICLSVGFIILKVFGKI